jgi:hypothetical protein
VHYECDAVGVFVRGTSNKPTKQFRLGLVVASVFENEHEDRTFHNVVVSRLYRADKEATEWSRSHSFDVADLPRVAEVTRQAYVWVHQHRQGEL